MSAYYRAINTGKGFITHADSEAINFEGYGSDLWKVSGDYTEWVTRVGATLVDPVVAQAEIAELLKIPKEPITVLQFRNRFTQAEKVAIYTAAESNIEVKIWLDDLNAATEVRTDDQATIDGINGLVDAGLIDAARVDEILQ